MVFLGVLYEAVISVSHQSVWTSSTPKLGLVETVDRRDRQLPFVGQERRQPGADGESVEGANKLPPQRVA